MAKTNPITTATAKATASATTYGTKITLPFEADRLTFAVISSTGAGSLILSFDGVNDAVTLHNTSGTDNMRLEQQRAQGIWYRVDAAATSYTFIVNAETPAYPNMF